MLHQRYTQNIQINKAIGKNEKCVFYFTEKNHMHFLANPVASSVVSTVGELCADRVVKVTLHLPGEAGKGVSGEALGCWLNDK